MALSSTLADAHACAQGRTDVVTLGNGDRITGEVIRLERGRLEFKTDDAGTLYLEWDKLSSVVTMRLVEVGTADGRWFLGTLASTAVRSLAVVAPDVTVSLPMMDVTMITAIGKNFWTRLDGSVDLGFSYTQSSGIAQLNANWSTVYRRPSFQFNATASATETKQDDGSDGDDRASLDLSYMRHRGKRLFVAGGGRLESNKSLGIDLRSQLAGTVGARLVNSNRAQLAIGAGLAFNDEQGTDVESTQNLEAVMNIRTSYFTYDRPKTNVDISLQYFPSLSDFGRQRAQFDASIKREFLKDLFLSVTLYNSFDSRPPNPAADSNDVGIFLSVGWSY